MAAMGVARPLPYLEASPPRFREFLAEALKRPVDADEAAARPASNLDR
jgi:hypothetical protein